MNTQIKKVMMGMLLSASLFSVCQNVSAQKNDTLKPLYSYGGVNMSTTYNYFQEDEKSIEGAREDFYNAIGHFTLQEACVIMEVVDSNGNSYEQDSFIVIKPDIETGLFDLQVASDKNYPPADVLLGLLYMADDYFTQDKKNAVKYFKKAADNKDINGMCALAYAYYKGDGVEKDIDKSIKLWKKVAKSEYPGRNNTAKAFLGDCYLNGTGVTKDLKKAFSYYKSAVFEPEDKYIIIEEETEDDNGNIIKPEKKRKAKANEITYGISGNIHAAYQLAQCYYNGWGCEKDINLATYWWQTITGSYFYSYNNGDEYSSFLYDLATDACFLTGESYYKGEGFKQNKEKAIDFYKKAAEMGHKKAKDKLQSLQIN